MDEGRIVVDSIVPIALSDVTDDLARESGFDSVDDLLGVAKHGRGDNVYLIRFHYLPPGAWDTPRWSRTVNSADAVDPRARVESSRLAGGRERAPTRARRRQP